MKAYLEIEMPTSCYYCPMTNDGFYLCKVTSPFKELEDDCEEYRPEWCPLVRVPPHGRLIDADALTDAIDSIDWYHQAPNKEMVHGANSAEHQAWYKEQDIFAAVENAPTVIPAEPEKENEQ